MSTNAAHLRIDDLLASGISTIVITLDGVTKESHEKYRVGSDFQQIKSTIESLAIRRKELGITKTNITVQTIVFATTRVK